MGDFVANRAIVLSSPAGMSTSTMTWEDWTDNSSTGIIYDIGTPGVMEAGVEEWSGATFTGWLVEIDGREYGVFQIGPLCFIPFNTDLHDIRLHMPTGPGQTTTKVAATAAAANCFVAGTRIATPEGEVPIEALRRGGRILTATGRQTTVRWLWRQTVRSVPILSETLMPVRISAHAFGPGQPVRDLTLSADHGVVLDGLLINAGALVDGQVVRFVPLQEMPAQFVYFHVETPGHDTILANGLPAESFIDYAGRRAFDNFDAYLAAFGAEALIREMPLPRISSARMVPRHLRPAARTAAERKLKAG